MKKVSKEEVEKSIAAYLSAKQAKKEAEAIMKNTEAIIEQYGLENLQAFVDNRLVCCTGIIQIKAGAAKPMRDGKPLSTTERGALAADLPREFVKISPDFTALYGCQDAKVRQILKARGIEIVREDCFAII